MGKFQIRIPDEELDRWQKFAEEEGYPSLSALIRRCVEDRIADATRVPLATPVVAEPLLERAIAPKARKVMCEHRIPADAYCARCD